jgi:Pyruvate/2-oxoacid:ferredoxin oxidoreductase delta subunit
LAPLTLRKKRQLKIGTAEVITEACIAWDRNLDCMACQEHCPYNAIDSDFSEEGVARPVVDTEICRGCGLCYKACPAEQKGNAIRMFGVESQTHIDDGYADLFEELENS